MQIILLLVISAIVTFQYPTMFALGFRSLSRRISTRSESLLARHLSTSAHHHSRRPAIGLAVIVAAATSTTALAASQGNSKAPNNEPRTVQSPVVGKTACEAAETTTISTQTFPETLLEYDHYNGTIVHLDWFFQSSTSKDDPDSIDQQQELQDLQQKWASHPDQFEQLLQRSLQKWREEGKKGIWIHLPRSMASVVPVCIKHGFDFHSCQNHVLQSNKENDGSSDPKGHSSTTTLILSQWLPTDVPSRLPLGPYFQCGVGCVVLHPEDCGQMLVVQELAGPAAARRLWKMPTGLIDPGEDVGRAAERELTEETGLTAQCRGILAFRQAHGASAGRASSDLFFVCLLTLPEGHDASSLLSSLKAQEHEIADIRWMSVEDYCNQETWQKSPVYLELNQAIRDAVDNQRKGKATPIVIPQELPVGWMRGTNTVYRST